MHKRGTAATGSHRQVSAVAPAPWTQGRGQAPDVGEGWMPRRCMAATARSTEPWLWVATISSAWPPATASSMRDTQLHPPGPHALSNAM